MNVAFGIDCKAMDLSLTKMEMMFSDDINKAKEIAKIEQQIEDIHSRAHVYNDMSKYLKKQFKPKETQNNFGKCKVCGKTATHMHNVHDSWSGNPHSQYVPLCDDCWHH